MRRGMVLIFVFALVLSACVKGNQDPLYDIQWPMEPPFDLEPVEFFFKIESLDSGHFRCGEYFIGDYSGITPKVTFVGSRILPFNGNDVAYFENVFPLEDVRVFIGCRGQKPEAPSAAMFQGLISKVEIRLTREQYETAKACLPLPIGYCLPGVPSKH